MDSESYSELCDNEDHKKSTVETKLVPFIPHTEADVADMLKQSEPVASPNSSMKSQAPASNLLKGHTEWNERIKMVQELSSRESR